jgi:hypothetical protein
VDGYSRLIKVKERPHFASISSCRCRTIPAGSGDGNEINAAPQEHIAENKSRLCLAGADIVVNQQID